MHSWVSVTEHSKVLKNVQNFIELKKLKIDAALQQLRRTEEREGTLVAQKKELTSLSDKAKKQITANFTQKWAKGKELSGLLSKLQDSVNKGDEKGTRETLIEIASSQIDDPEIFKGPTDLQKSLNSALSPLLETSKDDEGVDDLLLKLRLGSGVLLAAKKWGLTLPQMRAFLTDKIQDQALASPETPFSDAAKKLLDKISSPEDGNEVLDNLMQPSEEEDKGKLSALLKDAIKNPESKKSSSYWDKGS